MYHFSNINVVDTKEINIEVIYSLIKYLRFTRSNCLNSVNKKVGTLKRALKFNHLSISGVSDFKKLKFPTKHFDIVPEESLKILLKYLNSLDETSVNLTRHLIFMLLLYTGARANELVNIKIKNIDTKLNMILLETTKSKKPRFVFYDESINDKLKKYIQLKDREYLFYNFRSRVDGIYTKRHLRAFFDYLKKKFNMNSLHPHMLRHTMTTLLADNNAPIFTIQELLGHESINTTMIYIHLSGKKIREDYKNFFPKL
ncbi:site-specific integrase [Mycoplasmatota bacterium WC30]